MNRIVKAISLLRTNDNHEALSYLSPPNQIRISHCWLSLTVATVFADLHPTHVRLRSGHREAQSLCANDKGQHRVDADLPRRPRLYRSAELAKSSRKVQRLHQGLSKRQRSRRRTLLVWLRSAETGPKRRSSRSAHSINQQVSEFELASAKHRRCSSCSVDKADVEQALDRDNCEIKILALQSLFQADQERAIGIVTEALRANPAQCQGFQAAAVSMLGSHGGPRVVPILLDIARSNPDLKLRLTAIKRLGEQHSEQVTDELIKIYDADQDQGNPCPDSARAR